jgi:hypothetical protein
MVLSLNNVEVQLDQELNSSKSHIGLRKMMHYLKYEIGLTPFCFTDADLLIPAYT